MENVTERLLREEQKLKEKGIGEEGLSAKGNPKKRQVICHYCKKPGHFKRDCRAFAQAQSKEKPRGAGHSANQVTEQGKESNSREAMVVAQALSATSKKDWIVDSGATSHMCNGKELFQKLNKLTPPDQVAVGDGHILEVEGEGTVPMQMLMRNGETKVCDLENVLYVPKLACMYGVV